MVGPQPWVHPELQPYHQWCQELSVEDGCLLRRTRVIVLPSLQGKVLGSGHTQSGTICGQLMQAKPPGVPLGILSPLAVALLLV